MNTPIIAEDGRILGREWVCRCGSAVESYMSSDVICSCGRLFNCYGQELAPVSQWEEQDDY